MARVSFEYQNFKISKLATAISYVGGLLSTLVLLPGIVLFAGSFLGLFTNGITNSESWLMLGASLLLCVVCFGISMAVRFLFDLAANAIAKAKLKKILKKKGVEL